MSYLILSFLKYLSFNLSSIFNDPFLFFVVSSNEGYFRNNLIYHLRLNFFKKYQLILLINVKLFIFAYMSLRGNASYALNS